LTPSEDPSPHAEACSTGWSGYPFSAQEVADRLAIYDLYDRYAHAIDALDIETLERDLFMPDIVIDWREAGGVRASWEQAKAELVERNPFPTMFHQSGNHRIDFDPDGTRARVKTKMLHPTVAPDAAGNPVMFQVQGGYDDELVRTPNGWRIQSRLWRRAWTVGPLGSVSGGIPGIARAALSS
jgi:hypothetical protein